MINILKIFARDVKRIYRNVMAMIVVIGVLVVPCLYAWFNIAASWDPYNNTGNLKVAVASVDEGYEGSLIPIEMNVGDQVISALRENTQMDWVFTGKEKALEGVRSGKYYAAIVVPEDFSVRMMSIFSDEINKPEIVYYSNAKENAIAPKVTDKGATAIQKQVNTVFIETISDTAMTVLQSVSNMAEANGADSMVTNFINNMDSAAADLTLTAGTLDAFSGITEASQGLLDASADFMDELQSESEDGKKVLADSEETFTGMQEAISAAASSMSSALASGQNMYGKISQMIDQAFEDGVNGSESASETLVSTAKTVDKLISAYETMEKNLTAIIAQQPDTASTIAPLITKLKEAITKLEALRDNLNEAAADLDETTEEVIDDKKELKALVKESKEGFASVQSEYEDNVKGTLEALAESIGDTSSDLTDLTERAKDSAEGIYTLTSTAGSDLSQLQTALEKSGKLLDQSAQKLSSIAKEMRQMQENGDYTQLQEMIYDNKSGISSFLAAPVELETTRIFPIENYGSSMAPFYSTLSIWIGGIVLVAMLKVTVSEKNLKGLRNVKIGQIYLGRSIIFFLLGIGQSLLIALGDLYYLGIQCEHPFLFVFASCYSSVVYVAISYTLTVSFGDIGKAISVILLVVQVAGTGGTFPIECAPEFFQAVYPLLPFKYSMAAMREAVGGLYGMDYWINLAELGIFFVIALFVGLVLRKPIIRLNEAFSEKLEETKLI